MNRMTRIDGSKAAKYFNYGVKVAIVLAFFVALTFPLENLEGKGMLMRVPLFVGPAFIVPLIGYLKKWKPHKHMADALVTMPFLLDTLGNIFGLFDSIRVFDDILHFVNWFLLVAAFHAFRFRRVNDKRDAVLLGAGFGALAIIVWELIEWLLSVDGLGTLNGLHLSYGDTVGDLLMSTIGGVVGSFVIVWLFGPKK